MQFTKQKGIHSNLSKIVEDTVYKFQYNEKNPKNKIDRLEKLIRDFWLYLQILTIRYVFVIIVHWFSTTTLRLT